MRFNFPFRFDSWLYGEALNPFLYRYFGSEKFKNMKTVYSRDIKLKHCTIQVFQLFMKNEGYDDPLDTVYVLTDREYEKLMKAIL